MKKILTILSVCTLVCVHSFAQDDSQLAVDSTVIGNADMPESMFATEEDLMTDYNNKVNLAQGNVASRNLSYDDSVIVNRLSRIPTVIEMPLNNVTRKFIDDYARRKGAVSVMLGASNFYMPIFEEALERYGLPLELKYLPVIESALRPTATSRAGAAGLWQFMIATGKRYGLEVNTLVDERRDPVKSSDAAARYLRDLYSMFNDWGLAIAAYNYGEYGVQRAVIRSGNQEGADFWSIYNRLPHETRGYVPAFIAANYIMNYYCEHGISPYKATLPAESDTVVVKADTKFDKVAQICNVTVDELRAINPQYRRDIVPYGYSLRLPVSSMERFVVNEDSIYGITHGGDITALRRAVTEDVGTQTDNSRTRKGRNSASAGAKYYTVRKGDTLGAIAKRHGTTADKLRRLNGIKGDGIRANQKIRVK